MKFLVFIEITNRIDSMDFKYQIEADSREDAIKPAEEIKRMFPPSKYTKYEISTLDDMREFDEEYPIYRNS